MEFLINVNFLVTLVKIDSFKGILCLRISSWLGSLLHEPWHPVEVLLLLVVLAADLLDFLI